MIPPLVELFADRAKTLFPPILTRDRSGNPDPEWWKPEVHAQRVALGVQTYLEDTIPFDERPRVQAVAQALEEKAAIRSDDDLELYRWLQSFLLYGRYVEAYDKSEQEGDETALANLPRVVQLDPAFWLGQWWVRALIAIWHEKKEYTKIERVLLRSPGKGKRSYVEQHLTFQRDWAFSLRVEELRATGLGYEPALKRAEEHLRAGEFGPLTNISFAGLRTVYDRMCKEYGDLFPSSKK